MSYKYQTDQELMWGLRDTLRELEKRNVDLKQFGEDNYKKITESIKALNLSIEKKAKDEPSQ